MNASLSAKNGFMPVNEPLGTSTPPGITGVSFRPQGGVSALPGPVRQDLDETGVVGVLSAMAPAVRRALRTAGGMERLQQATRTIASLSDGGRGDRLERGSPGIGHKRVGIGSLRSSPPLR